MKIYVTNFSYRNMPFRKFIVVHYYEDCDVLNSDYEKDGDRAPNSGVKHMTFESEAVFSSLLKKYDSTLSVCESCSLRDLHEPDDRGG